MKFRIIVLIFLTSTGLNAQVAASDNLKHCTTLAYLGTSMYQFLQTNVEIDSLAKEYDGSRTGAGELVKQFTTAAYQHGIQKHVLKEAIIYSCHKNKQVTMDGLATCNHLQKENVPSCVSRVAF